MGFEPTTFCLGSKHSTTELRPPAVSCHYNSYGRQRGRAAPPWELSTFKVITIEFGSSFLKASRSREMGKRLRTVECCAPNLPGDQVDIP